MTIYPCTINFVDQIASQYRNSSVKCDVKGQVLVMQAEIRKLETNNVINSGHEIQPSSFFEQNKRPKTVAELVKKYESLLQKFDATNADNYHQQHLDFDLSEIDWDYKNLIKSLNKKGILTVDDHVKLMEYRIQAEICAAQMCAPESKGLDGREAVLINLGWISKQLASFKNPSHDSEFISEAQKAARLVILDKSINKNRSAAWCMQPESNE